MRFDGLGGLSISFSKSNALMVGSIGLTGNSVTSALDLMRELQLISESDIYTLGIVRYIGVYWTDWFVGKNNTLDFK